MWVTSPVGSPPLKILAGRTSPNPVPCANTPAGRPRVGTAAPWLGVLAAAVPAELAGPAHPAQTSTAAVTGRIASAAGHGRRPGQTAGIVVTRSFMTAPPAAPATPGRQRTALRTRRSPHRLSRRAGISAAGG